MRSHEVAVAELNSLSSSRVHMLSSVSIFPSASTLKMFFLNDCSSCLVDGAIKSVLFDCFSIRIL